jgi:hypothetical protein
MDLFVVEKRERGNQTPTLSGEAIKEEGENIVRSEIFSWHQHETKNASWHRGSDATILSPGRGCHSKNRNATSASL